MRARGEKLWENRFRSERVDGTNNERKKKRGRRRMRSVRQSVYRFIVGCAVRLCVCGVRGVCACDLLRLATHYHFPHTCVVKRAKIPIYSFMWMPNVCPHAHTSISLATDSGAKQRVLYMRAFIVIAKDSGLSFGAQTERYDGISRRTATTAAAYTLIHIRQTTLHVGFYREIV